MLLKYDRHTSQHGFTLMEMLIVIAIIAALIAIAIPLFVSQLNNAKVAVDQTAVRNARAVAAAQYMVEGGVQEGGVYYYDQATSTLKGETKGIAGYGQYGSDDREDEIGAVGTPCTDGRPGFLCVVIGEGGQPSFTWTDTAIVFSGQMTSSDAFKETTQEQRILIDSELLDALDYQFRNMTYRQIDEMLASYKMKETWGNSGNACYNLAVSTIYKNTSVPDTSADRNAIYAKSVFEAAGYDTSVDADKLYIVTSESGKYNVRMCLDIGANLDRMTDEQKDQLATTAFTYVLGDNDELKHNARASLRN